MSELAENMVQNPTILIDENVPTPDSAPLSPSTTFSCEMCQNYEINLTILQDNERKLKEELKAVKSLSDRYESELSTERAYRKDLEKKMSEVAVQTEDKLKESEKVQHSLQEVLRKTADYCDDIKKSHLNRLEEMQKNFEDLENKMEQLTAKYSNLLGTNRALASEMREEPIDVPEDKDSLQLQCLLLREQLIETKAAKEHLQAELTDECAVLRAQLQEDRNVRDSVERDLTEQINQLNTELAKAKSRLSSAAASLASSDENMRRIAELQHTVSELEMQVQQVQDQRKALEQTCQNYKSRCSSLQIELDTSEQVQKDFVKLSQSLQIQLEKIRQSEQEVRWQFDDDVEGCGDCGSSLQKNKPKPHCRHCGKIFCSNCLKSTVPAGSARRPANVCQVCHTLLNRDSAPFFSKD